MIKYNFAGFLYFLIFSYVLQDIHWQQQKYRSDNPVWKFILLLLLMVLSLFITTITCLSLHWLSSYIWQFCVLFSQWLFSERGIDSCQLKFNSSTLSTIIINTTNLIFLNIDIKVQNFKPEWRWERRSYCIIVLFTSTIPINLAMTLPGFRLSTPYYHSWPFNAP